MCRLIRSRRRGPLPPPNAMYQLLDVADNLERAIASAREAGSGEGGDSSHDVLLQGVEMTSQEVRAEYACEAVDTDDDVSY